MDTVLGTAAVASLQNPYEIVKDLCNDGYCTEDARDNARRPTSYVDNHWFSSKSIRLNDGLKVWVNKMSSYPAPPLPPQFCFVHRD